MSSHNDLPESLQTVLNYAKTPWKSLQEWVSLSFGGKEQKASGSVHGDGDVTVVNETYNAIFECKYRTNSLKSILSDWNKLDVQASRNGKIPYLIAVVNGKGYAVRRLHDDPQIGNSKLKLENGIYTYKKSCIYVTNIQTLLEEWYEGMA